MRKNNVALFVATFCYGVSIICAALMYKYAILGFVVVLLFPIGGLNIKRLWLYSLRNIPSEQKKGGQV